MSVMLLLAVGAYFAVLVFAYGLCAAARRGDRKQPHLKRGSGVG